MVLPTGGILISNEIEVIDAAEQLPTKTYKLDFDKGTCRGFIEGKEAMEQAIFKVLNTIRFKHLIYSDDYGFEDMVGYERLYVRGELPRRITEALLQDERIKSIEDMLIEFSSDEALASFTAITIYGDVHLLREGISGV
ncbi:MAG: DUF2634 domain-containing protein [Lysinibacillus sp.]